MKDSEHSVSAEWTPSVYYNEAGFRNLAAAFKKYCEANESGVA